MEKKSFDGDPTNYDDDSYDDVVEVKVVESREELVANIDLTKATPRELLIYFADRFKETHGYSYNVEWVKESAIFKSFLDRYGVDAGPMVALLFDNHKGKLNDLVMTATAFSKGSKWIQDTLYIELQQQKQKEQNRNSTEGLMSTDDFIERFAV
jgi:hypothetical protein